MYEFSPISGRIARMKARYRDTPFTLDTERAFIVTDTYTKHKHTPAPLKKAQSLYDVCERMTIRVEDDELIVGNIDKHYKGTTMWPENDGMAWLYDELESGVFDAREVQDEPMNFPQEEIVIVCDAYILLAKRYASACRDKAVDTIDEDRKNELLKMADSLDWISENPARTFHEFED